ncbi:type II CAAX prenyl endopeptidase Rce1 family protein [Ornithinimicrobium cavernae]|uniref:CPBP family glutamic-type intramembrane protease n=1 Tax=Ornithinimicrobium cavernae TaxID=2666047 RepID=UPI000D69A737|nr:CPBP family glutamic-type intramembrane protease [Ornithinimicrobium cavernae]
MTHGWAGGPGRPPHELRRFLQDALLRPVPRDHRETDRAFRRRRAVCAVTLVVGAVVLGLGLHTAPGDPRFIVLTSVLALVWASGALVAGPLHLGRGWTRRGGRARPVVQSVVLGLLMVAVFCAGAVLVARVPVLRDAVNDVLDHARYAPLPLVALITLVNGLAEEMFFRGALYAAVGAGRQVLVTTGLYVLVTAASGNLVLVLAAAVLGLLVGAQRRVTGGVLGPALTHVTWSVSLLLLLPPLLAALS